MQIEQPFDSLPLRDFVQVGEVHALPICLHSWPGEAAENSCAGTQGSRPTRAAILFLPPSLPLVLLGHPFPHCTRGGSRRRGSVLAQGDACAPAPLHSRLLAPLLPQDIEKDLGVIIGSREDVGSLIKVGGCGGRS